MGFIKYRLSCNTIFCVALIVLTCSIDSTQSQNNKDQDNAKERSDTSRMSKYPIEAKVVPNMGKPGLLFFNLRSTNQVQVRYTVSCLTRNSSYQLGVIASNPHVAVVQGESSYNVSCADGLSIRDRKGEIFTQQGDSPSNTSAALGNITTAAAALETPLISYNLLERADSTQNSVYIGEISGTFNLTLRARNIGRSFFIIIAKKLSGPDTPPDAGKEDGNGRPAGQHGDGASSKRAEGRKQRHKDQVGQAMIIVMQLPRTIDEIFRVVLKIVIVLATAGMGLKVKVDVVKQVLKKPIGPIIGFCCQFICMPIIAYVVAKSVPQESAAVALGIFTCGAVPGGGVSNMFCYLLDGDVSLSVTMTTISNIAALGMTPLWIFTLGSTFSDDEVVLEVPYLKILETLAYVIFPLFVGIFIQVKFPKLEKLISKILKPFILVIVAGVIALGVYTNLYVFQMIRPMVILAGCLLPYCGYMVGALASLLFCQTWRHVKTIAIETGIQNTGIAFMMLYLSLPPPDNQLATVGPAASAIMTPQPLFLTVIVFLIYKRCTREKGKSGETTDDDSEETGTAGESLVSSSKGRESDDTRRDRCLRFLSGGSKKAALVLLWEKLTGTKAAGPMAAEMLNQEISVPSPTSTTDEKEGLWKEFSKDSNAKNGTGIL